MKKVCKNLMAVLLCLTMILSTGVFAFALGTVSKPKISATYNSITLSWSKVSNADGYEVYIASGSSWKRLAVTASRTYTHKSLKFNATYKYRVRAYDKGSSKTTYGAFSPVVSAKTALTGVKDFKVSAATENSFKLSWSKVSGATGYQLFRYLGGEWVYAYKTTRNSTTVSKAKLGATYPYRVRAYRTVNGKDYYGSFSATLNAQCALTPVSGVKSSVTATSATLAWKTVSSASGYQVYLKNGSKWVKQANVTSTKYTIKGLGSSTKYQIRLRSYKKVGNVYIFSVWTNYSFTTAKSAVTPPKTIEEACAVYNKAVNTVKKMKNGTVNKVGSVNIQCTDCSVSFLQDSVNKILTSFAMPNDTTVTVRNGVAKDQDGNPVNLNDWITPSGRSCTLKEQYVSSVSLSTYANGYLMVIYLYDEESTYDGQSTNLPVGHKSCTDPFNPAAISLPAGVRINAAYMYYPGAVLGVFIDNSGKLTDLYVYLPVNVSIAGYLGTSVTIGAEAETEVEYFFTY